MAALLANCREYKIGDKVESTVSEQVNTDQYCSLVICDYRKVHELYDTSNKTGKLVEIVFLRGGVSEIECLKYQQNNVNPFQICNNWIQLSMLCHVIRFF